MGHRIEPVHSSCRLFWSRNKNIVKYRVMLSCVLRAHVKQPKNKNILLKFVRSIN